MCARFLFAMVALIALAACVPAPIPTPVAASMPALPIPAGPTLKKVNVTEISDFFCDGDGEFVVLRQLAPNIPGLPPSPPGVSFIVDKEVSDAAYISASSTPKARCKTPDESLKVAKSLGVKEKMEHPDYSVIVCGYNLDEPCLEVVK